MFLAVCGVLGAQRHFRVLSHLLDSWEALRTWKRLKPSKRRRPLSPYILKCIVVCCLARAGLDPHGAWKWVGTAILLLTGFAGIARPGELFGLYVDAVGLPDDQRIGGGFIAILVVRSPKNRAHMGVQQLQWSERLAGTYLASCPPSLAAPLGGGSGSECLPRLYATPSLVAPRGGWLWVGSAGERLKSWMGNAQK